MNTFKAFTLSTIFALSGCATCRNHPVACGVAVAIIVGGVAYAASRHHHDQTVPAGVLPSCVAYYEQNGETMSQAETDCR